MIYRQIEELIGDTPLLQLSEQSHGLKNIDVYIKLEYLNPFGSIKDRTVLGLTKKIDFDDLQKQEVKLIESSSGNTAKALQIIASRHKTSLVSVTNRVKVTEVDQMLKYIGTEIISLPGKSECPDPNQDDNALTRIETMIRENPKEYVHTEQYTDLANPAIHERTTAHEIFSDLPEVDYVISSVGTGGSSGGIIDYIKHNNLSTKVIGVVAHPNDFIPGIRTMNELFETPLFTRSAFDEIKEVDSLNALKALDILVRHEGILAGPTTGASFSVLINHLQTQDTLRSDGSRKSVVFFACDRLDPYMSYIAKRLPERFNSNTQTDFFGKNINQDYKLICEVTPDDSILQWINEQDVQIIDIRGVKPFRAFHIENSISYPEDILREVSENATPFDNNKPILFVCPKGDRSLFIASVLRDRGIESYSLEGGLRKWRSAKLPLKYGSLDE